MSEQEVLDKVIQLISERFSVDVLKITKDTTFQEDLGADSLDVVELVMELEDAFGIQISDEDAEQIVTIGDAVNYIVSQQA
ncbi:acyl carrier protein [Granulicatella elegans]|jgi:acyl carrier protein|uniref:Acyl carrier protein n=1 Tax=Granulicatella elegans ATCC 700633 TaxID=626369 RepID=D0BMS1_9LACT|nr:acyl carrier protein [Granulicatella elegans]EEW92775.1 acyl carrier protein [Granulicatella elegans ATCC 700633]MBF0992584.1 acyl carrier protein [Granulicatella sp.]RKW26201.1 MAG: acyl carrier protein [Granulicatella sp.]RKW27095.1 MAG: acyl carrier protein [Granulicatella sp.]